MDKEKLKHKDNGYKKAHRYGYRKTYGYVQWTWKNISIWIVDIDKHMNTDNRYEKTYE